MTFEERCWLITALKTIAANLRLAYFQFTVLQQSQYTSRPAAMRVLWVKASFNTDLGPELIITLWGLRLNANLYVRTIPVNTYFKFESGFFCYTNQVSFLDMLYTIHRACKKKKTASHAKICMLHMPTHREIQALCVNIGALLRRSELCCVCTIAPFSAVPLSSLLP